MVSSAFLQQNVLNGYPKNTMKAQSRYSIYDNPVWFILTLDHMTPFFATSLSSAWVLHKIPLVNFQYTNLRAQIPKLCNVCWQSSHVLNSERLRTSWVIFPLIYAVANLASPDRAASLSSLYIGVFIRRKFSDRFIYEDPHMEYFWKALNVAKNFSL